MNKSAWLTVAESLVPGGRTRTVCSFGCREGDQSQLISHNEKGYHAFCFRCNESAFEGHGMMSIARIQKLRTIKASPDGEVKLPTDYTLDVPSRHAVWYYKYGIGDSLAREYRIGWSDELQRIIIPVYQGDFLVAVQMRAVLTGHTPKYLNLGGKSIGGCMFYSQPIKPSETIIVTEDIMSAIKVGRVFNAVSIMGTTMTPARAMTLCSLTNKVIIWLDGDAAGIKGARRAEKQLGLYGIEARVIRTPKDPKDYSLQEIKKHSL